VVSVLMLMRDIVADTRASRQGSARSVAGFVVSSLRRAVRSWRASRGRRDRGANDFLERPIASSVRPESKSRVRGREDREGSSGCAAKRLVELPLPPEDDTELLQRVGVARIAAQRFEVVTDRLVEPPLRRELPGDPVLRGSIARIDALGPSVVSRHRVGRSAHDPRAGAQADERRGFGPVTPARARTASRVPPRVHLLPLSAASTSTTGRRGSPRDAPTPPRSTRR